MARRNEHLSPEFLIAYGQVRRKEGEKLVEEGQALEGIGRIIQRQDNLLQETAGFEEHVTRLTAIIDNATQKLTERMEKPES